MAIDVLDAESPCSFCGGQALKMRVARLLWCCCQDCDWSVAAPVHPEDDCWMDADKELLRVLAEMGMSPGWRPPQDAGMPAGAPTDH